MLIFEANSYLFSSNRRTFSWTHALFFSLAYGIMITIFTRRKTSSFSQTLGLSNPEQLGLLRDAVKSGTLPADPVMRQAMPAYVAKQLKAAVKTKKEAPKLLLFFAVLFLLSIAVHEWLLGAVFILSLGYTAYSYWPTIKRIEHLTLLQEELTQQGIKPTVPYELQIEPDKSNHNRVHIIGVALLFLIAIAIMLVTNAPRPRAPSTNPTTGASQSKSGSSTQQNANTDTQGNAASGSSANGSDSATSNQASGGPDYSEAPPASDTPSNDCYNTTAVPNADCSSNTLQPAGQ